MAAKDIRRQTGEIQPNLFVRPGVENTALAEAITAIGQGVISVDSAIGKEQLAAELDKARSEFIVGEVEDKPDSDPELDAAVAKELSPLKRQLAGLKNASDQGILRGDVFKMRADAILQSAIARRPGLAPEYRQMHAEFTGGAIIEKLMEQEQAAYNEALKSRESAGKQAEENKMFQLNVMKEAGFAAEAAVLVNSPPEIVNAEFLKRFNEISGLESAKRRSEALTSAARGMEATNTLDRPQAIETWNSTYDLGLQGVAKVLREAPAMLSQADEATFSAMIGDWSAQMSQMKANLEAERVRLGLKPEDISGQMQVIRDLEEQGQKILDGTVELNERKRRVETFKYHIEAMIQKDSPVTAAIAALEQRGAHEMVKWMYENNKLLSRQTGQEMQKFILEGVGDPSTITPLAAGMAQNTLKDMFPKGSITKNPNMDFGAGVQDLVNMGKAFIVTPSDKQKVKPFAEWVEELDAYKEQMTKLLDQSQKDELSTALRLATHKLNRTAYLSLKQSNPSLASKIQFNPQAGSDIIIFKPDTVPTDVEETLVDQANQQLAYSTTLGLLKSIGGYKDTQAAHLAILKSAEEVQGQINLSASEKFERTKATGKLTGPAVRWWEQ